MTHGPITKDPTSWALGLMQVRVGASLSNIASITPVLTQSHSLGAMANTKYLGTAEFFKQMSGFPETEDGVIPLRESAALECGFKELTPYNMAIARGLDPTASVAASVDQDVSVVSAAGTTSGDILVSENGLDWGVIDEEWTVIFTGATAGVIVGKTVGHVHTFSGLTSAMQVTDDGGTDHYFVLPASFFTGTWAPNDTYVFHTHAGGSSLYSNNHSGDIGLGGLAQPVDVRVEAVYTFPNGTNTLTYIFPRAQVVAQMESDFNAEDAAVIPVTFESKNASSNVTTGNAAWDSMPLGRVIWA